MLGAARSEADTIVGTARSEAEAVVGARPVGSGRPAVPGHAEAAQTAESARAAADELLAQAGVEARGLAEAAQREAEKLLAAAHAGAAVPEARA